ncbi:unnamed protein product [Phytophthora fragariaefolia]|uniref:Unnamed protein product n=1 Tax=Phytophthora fragariaefolia TaxID=1490495 RepID=A0A9W7CYN3_9STRA|nr:unnamed protein product [Phytophthora fragariaefolia]
MHVDSLARSRRHGPSKSGASPQYLLARYQNPDMPHSRRQHYAAHQAQQAVRAVPQFTHPGKAKTVRVKVKEDKAKAHVGSKAMYTAPAKRWHHDPLAPKLFVPITSGMSSIATSMTPSRVTVCSNRLSSLMSMHKVSSIGMVTASCPLPLRVWR